jgi:hypothetical protein
VRKLSELHLEDFVALNRDIGKHAAKLFLSITALILFTSCAFASEFTNTTLFDWNGTANAVSITTSVTDTGSSYLWQYTISNSGFTPGINVFDLAIYQGNLPSFMYGQSNGWAINGVDNGVSGEWDLTGTSGISTGNSLTFSFYTAPMGWSPDLFAGLCNVGCAISNFDTLDSIYFGATGPYIPDPNVPGSLTFTPTPEPNSLSLALIGAAAILFTLWRKGTA